MDFLNSKNGYKYLYTPKLILCRIFDEIGNEDIFGSENSDISESESDSFEGGEKDSSGGEEEEEIFDDEESEDEFKPKKDTPAKRRYNTVPTNPK